MDKKILDHFKKSDPVLYEWIQKVHLDELPEPTNLFEELCDEIISQQLSGKAANTIFGRLKQLFPRGEITPEHILKLSDDKIRNSGTSWAKVRFLKDLATKVKNGELILENLKDLSDEEVIKELTQVKGIGPWTAEMYLMFTLGREDVFSHGDLGLKNAIKKIYDFKKEPTRKQVEKIVKKWSPYRTYACRVLWQSLE